MHPASLEDPLEASRHRGFLSVAVVTGALALVLMPLHLAFLGPTSLPVALVFAWMLSQWPLALYVSQSGRLDVGIGLSAFLFAVFLSGICALTGGVHSFAVLWFAVVPVEAALSGSRRIVAAAVALCAAAIAVVTLFPLEPPLYAFSDSRFLVLSAVLACLYAGGLAYRLTIERRLARALASARLDDVKTLSEGTPCLVFRCTGDGQLCYAGGNANHVLGFSRRQISGDRMVERIHVADRPIYLAAVAEARSAGEERSLELRVRHGGSEPGEAGTATYVWMEALIRPASGASDATVAFTDISRQKSAVAGLETAQALGRETEKRILDTFAGAGAGIRQHTEAVVQLAELLVALPENADPARARSRRVGEDICRGGRELLELAEGLERIGQAEPDQTPPRRDCVDLHGCIAAVSARVERAGWRLVLRAEGGVQTVNADERALCQMLVHAAALFGVPPVTGGTLELAISRSHGDILFEIGKRPVRQSGAPFRGGRSAIGERLDGVGARPAQVFAFSLVERLAAMHGGSADLICQAGEVTAVTARFPDAVLPVLTDQVSPGNGLPAASLKIA